MMYAGEAAPFRSLMEHWAQMRHASISSGESSAETWRPPGNWSNLHHPLAATLCPQERWVLEIDRRAREAYVQERWRNCRQEPMPSTGTGAVSSEEILRQLEAGSGMSLHRRYQALYRQMASQPSMPQATDPTMIPVKPVKEGPLGISVPRRTNSWSPSVAGVAEDAQEGLAAMELEQEARRLNQRRVEIAAQLQRMRGSIPRLGLLKSLLEDPLPEMDDPLRVVVKRIWDEATSERNLENALTDEPYCRWLADWQHPIPYDGQQRMLPPLPVQQSQESLYDGSHLSQRSGRSSRSSSSNCSSEGSLPSRWLPSLSSSSTASSSTAGSGSRAGPRYNVTDRVDYTEKELTDEEEGSGPKEKVVQPSETEHRFSFSSLSVMELLQDLFTGLTGTACTAEPSSASGPNEDRKSMEPGEKDRERSDNTSQLPQANLLEAMDPAKMEECVSLLISIPCNEAGQVTSLGSTLHEYGQCTPCKHWFKGMCRTGVACGYCHFEHVGQRAKRLRPSKQARRRHKHRSSSGDEHPSGEDEAGGEEAAIEFPEFFKNRGEAPCVPASPGLITSHGCRPRVTPSQMQKVAQSMGFKVAEPPRSSTQPAQGGPGSTKLSL